MLLLHPDPNPNPNSISPSLMAASFSTLPFRINLLPAASSPKQQPQQQQQQIFPISSSLRTISTSARLPIASSGFGFGFGSPRIRSKFTTPNSTSDEAASADTTVQTLDDENQAETVEATEEEEEEAAKEAKPPRPPIVKLGDIMGILNSRAVEAAEKERPVPDLSTGDIVEIKLEVPENRRRASIYKGIVISKQNAGIHTTIRIRRIIAGIGVEIVFPVYSPNIKEIKVVKHRKVRRARLYYLRDKLPRLSTFK